MIKKIILTLFLYIIFIFETVWLYRYNSNVILFNLNQPSSVKLNIQIDGNPVHLVGQYIIPISMTTVRPTKISINNVSRKVKVDNISKDNIIHLKIKYIDKELTYQLFTLPPFFPNYNILNPYHLKGNVLLSAHGLALKDPSYSFVMTMDGNIIYYRGATRLDRSSFSMQKIITSSGKIRYVTHIQDDPGIVLFWVRGYHLILDENFNELDRVKVFKTNKHPELFADEHDIIMLDDGHYIVIGYDIEDKIYQKNRKVQLVHTVIQEQKDGKVIFDWTSKDNPKLINGCYEKCPDTHEKNADYIHANSISIDQKDNNLLVSSASGYYIMKINRESGKIMWIMGGRLNQFDIPEEARFIRQHQVMENY